MTGTTKAMARREIEEFEGKGNTALAEELFAPDHTLHFPGFPPLDRAGHAQVLGVFREGFPDLRIRVAEQVAAGDRVANHWIARGTHQGMFRGIPATGKTVTFTGNNVMRFDAGRIREIWGQLDVVGLLAQLGVMPGAAPPEAPPEDPAPAAGDSEIAAASVVRRFATKFNEGRLDAIADDYGDDYVLDFPGGPTGRGKDGVRRATTEFRAAFPDLHFATEDMFDEGGTVAWRWTMTGTHRGKLGPFPASHRGVTLPGISLLRVRGSLVVRDCVRADMAGLLAQIGAMPA